MTDTYTRKNCNLANLLGIFDNTIKGLQKEVAELQSKLEQVRGVIKKLREKNDGQEKEG